MQAMLQSDIIHSDIPTTLLRKEQARPRRICASSRPRSSHRITLVTQTDTKPAATESSPLSRLACPDLLQLHLRLVLVDDDVWTRMERPPIHTLLAQQQRPCARFRASCKASSTPSSSHRCNVAWKHASSHIESCNKRLKDTCVTERTLPM